jgi:hypothetical protein
MDLALAAVAVASFAFGVLFHKYAVAVSEANSIKSHVSAEVAALRVELTSLVAKTSQVLHSASSKL